MFGTCVWHIADFCKFDDNEFIVNCDNLICVLNCLPLILKSDGSVMGWDPKPH